MAATQRANPLLRIHLIAQTVCPGAGGIDYRARFHFELPACFDVGNNDANHLSPGFQQAGHFHIIGGPAARAHGVLQDAQHQACIIGHGVGVVTSTFQSLAIDTGEALFNFPPGKKAMVFYSRQPVVNGEQNAERQAAGKLALAQGKVVAHALDQAGKFAQQALPLPQGIPRQPDVTLGNIAQAAVDHF